MAEFIRQRYACRLCQAETRSDHRSVSAASRRDAISSSTFSSQARDFVKHLSQRVVLLDGASLADLMIEHGIGVRTSRAIEFRRLDEDFFEES